MRLFLLALLTAIGFGACSHVAWTRTSFRWLSESPPALELRLVRHLDTILSGPDIEEDQTLLINLYDYRLNEPIRLPAHNVRVTFRGERFGPSSHALDVAGCILIRTATVERVVARLDLRIHASTRAGTYRSTERFRGEYIFRAEPVAGSH